MYQPAYMGDEQSVRYDLSMIEAAEAHAAFDAGLTNCQKPAIW